MVKNRYYGFEVKQGKKEAKLYYDGGLYGTVELLAAPVQEGETTYIYAIDLNNLFGLYTTWNNDTRVLDITYPEFSLESYGLPSVNAGDELVLNGMLREPGPYQGFLPEIQLEVIGVERNLGILGGNTVLNGVEGTYYHFYSLYRLNPGENRVRAVVKFGDRLLFARALTINSNIENMALNVNEEGGNSIHFSSPNQGYYELHENSFLVKGEAEVKVGEFLTAVIEKYGDGFKETGREKIPYHGRDFEHTITLTEGQGLYRVTIRGDVAAPRGSGKAALEITRFYLEYDETFFN